MIAKTILQRQRIRLEQLLAEHHLPALGLAIKDGSLWELPVTSVPHSNELDAFYSNAVQQYNCGFGLSFATVEETTGTVMGSTRFRATELTHRRVGIGFTFIAPSWQRTPVNAEAKYLMLNLPRRPRSLPTPSFPECTGTTSRSLFPLSSRRAPQRDSAPASNNNRIPSKV